MPKGVLTTQRQFLTNILNVTSLIICEDHAAINHFFVHEVTVGGRRAALRRGEPIPGLPEGPQKGILISVPLFHVTGLTSLAVRI